MTVQIIVVLLLLAVVFLLLALLRRTAAPSMAPLEARFAVLEKGQERAERVVREEMTTGRDEAVRSGRLLREEVALLAKGLGDSTVRSVGELRAALQESVRQLQQDNSRRLDEIRVTVDERLQRTLDQRLGDSFKQVSDRLEAVHKGLGEMQVLAQGVGDLKRVLTNVKSRGVWGEVQLQALLDQVLTPGQYETNVCCRVGSAERVEFALRLPGQGEAGDEPLYLPIDAKFPLEDYQRLVDAQERGVPLEAEQAGRQLEQSLKSCARMVSAKYLNPPRTTDFALLYLPTEGLYAEVLRRPGLAEWLQNEQRIMVTGPMTLTALLNSLQLGFRTLAIQQRSSEVWQLLGSVKAEFGRFGQALEVVERRLQQASQSVEAASRRRRVLERKLKQVEGEGAGLEPAPEELDVP